MVFILATSELDSLISNEFVSEINKEKYWRENWEKGKWMILKGKLVYK